MLGNEHENAINNQLSSLQKLYATVTRVEILNYAKNFSLNTIPFIIS
jgi:hypothetical protein